MKNNDVFETAVASVRDESIDAPAFAAAQERVRARLANEMSSAAATAAPTGAPVVAGEHQIVGCEGFRALLPAYLAGALAEPKRVLVEDHTRECLGCRKALAALRRGDAAKVAAPAARAGRRFSPRLALAAGLTGLAVVSGTLLFRAGVFAPTPTAAVQSIEGELVLVDANSTRPAVAGERFGGATAIRTGGNSGAVVTLADGSKVELAERSELTLGKRWDGTVLELARGSVIVEAAEQRRGHLYVETGDCQVSVVGTIFSVNAGSKGSRVSVIEGEVRVKQGTERAVLRPGDQIATGRFLGAVPVDQEISWSRNAANYRERLAALKSLGRELDRTFVSAGARTSTRLLDLAPEGTSVYVALPNLSQSLAQAWSLVEQRAAENPALGEWWNEQFADGDGEEISAAIESIERFGAELGDEIAVAVTLPSSIGDTTQPTAVVVAVVEDPARFSPILDAEIARVNALVESESPGSGHGIRRINDPSTAGGDGEELLVWLTGDLLVVSSSADRLAAVGETLASGSNSFVDSSFHARLARVYGGGTDWLLGVDVASAIAQEETTPTEDPERAARESRMRAELGIAGVEHFVIDRTDGDGEGEAGENHALLAFREERRGIASWLATPAPLGAFEFVSPSAHVAVAGLLKEPAAMLDDLIALARLSGTGDSSVMSEIAEVEANLGISLRNDLAASLGGDFAFAFDGPWLPTPSWKVVLEVADASRLHATVQALVEAWNREAESMPETGEPRPTFRLTQESVGGRLVFTLATEGGVEVLNGLFADGYLLLGPSRALLLEAVTQRAAGVTLAESQAFLDLLPRDGEAHVSALAYQNVGGSLGTLAELLERQIPEGGSGQGGEESAPDLAELAGEVGPGLAVIYAGGRDISFSSRGLRGPLGLSFESLLSLGGIFHSEPAAEPGAAADAAEQEALAPETRQRATA